MSTIRLPCHKGLARRTRNNKTRPPGGSRRLRPGQIPYVSHDNGKTRYYADRYYMDAPTALLEYQLEQREKTNVDPFDYCDYCGEIRQSSGDNNEDANRSARPLFDRAAFINSLDLSAAIIATYTVGDVEFLSETFPTLFPDSNKCAKYVPTLVLHGRRGWKLPETRLERNSDDAPDEWDAEQDDGEFDLEPNVRANGDVSNLDCYIGNASIVKTEPDQIASTPIDASVTDKDGQTETVACEENVPILTYENQTLNIRSTSKKRKRKNQTSEMGFSLRRSSRVCLQTSQKLVDGQSPMCSPGFIRDENALFQRQNLSAKGSKPIHTFSDTESYECNDDYVTVKSEYDKTTTIHATRCGPQTPQVSSNSNHIQEEELVNPLMHPQKRQTPSDTQVLLSSSNVSSSRRRHTKVPVATLPKSAASILARSFGSVPDVKFMKPLDYTTDSGDSCDDDSNSRQYVQDLNAYSTSEQNKEKIKGDEDMRKNNTTSVSPASVFGGEVYFTQVLPRWIPPKDKMNFKKRRKSDVDSGPTLEAVRGCHHPKFFLLFEKSGSLVVIVSTCNLTPQHAVDASWVQRFEPRINLQSNDGGVDYGMPQDFGYILADLLKKQSEAAVKNCMLPDSFLRRFVKNLSTGGLEDLPRRYKFESSHVHLVSTVPGDYCGHLPKKGVESFRNRPPYRHPSITYGPQRVAYILSRCMDKHHISVACATIPRGLDTAENGGTAAVTPWLPPALLAKNERLVIQPTSMSGTWDRYEMETIAKSYLEPHWEIDSNKGHMSPVDLIDIIWPSMSHFDSMHEKRRALKEKLLDKSFNSISKKVEKHLRGPCHVFLSSVAFNKLDRVCISRMALFQSSNQPYMKSYDSASLHFKSFCRLLNPISDRHPQLSKPLVISSATTNNCKQNVSKERITWFMLTSACHSKGAQGKPTPYRSLDSDSMSYANFELGVLFCSRILGDRVNDRLYICDNDFSGGCQCGSGKRWYKGLIKNDNPDFLSNVRKIALPVPYHLRPKPYQQDPELDFMSYTPYLHEIPPDTGTVGNMKLTPYGQAVSTKSSSINAYME